jgi:hypothetical protein
MFDSPVTQINKTLLYCPALAASFKSKAEQNMGALLVCRVNKTNGTLPQTQLNRLDKSNNNRHKKDTMARSKAQSQRH